MRKGGDGTTGTNTTILQTRSGEESSFGSWLVVFLAAAYYLVQSILSPVPGLFWGEVFLLAGTALSVLLYPSDTLEVHVFHVSFLILYTVNILITLATACFQPAFSVYDFVIRSARWAAYILCGAMIAAHVDFARLRKQIIIISVLLSLLLMVQVVVYRFTGRVLSWRVGHKVLGASLEGRYRNGVRISSIYRFSAIFSEPAHFAYYVTTGLVLLLFYRREDLPATIWELFAGFVMVVALVMSTSTYGLGLLGIVAVVFAYRRLRNTRNAAYSALTVMMVLLGFIALVFLLRNSSIYDYLLRKLDTFGTTNRTTFIWQGDWKFPRLMAWLGCGVGNEEYFFKQVFNYNLNYMNSISMSYLYCGVVGIVMLVLFFLVNLVFCDRNGRVILLVLAAMTLFSTMFYGPLIALFGIIIVGGERYYRELTAGGEA